MPETATINRGSAGRSITTRAAVLHAPGHPLVVEELALEAPRVDEVLVRTVAAGICHSDLSVVRNHLGAPLPAVLGHEGAGVVEAVGPAVRGLEIGDHVAFLFRASCGHCKWCHGGRPALCPDGSEPRRTGLLPDGTSRFSLDGELVHHFTGISAFAEHTVLSQSSVIAVPKELPLESMAIVGCAVMTGVGAVLNAAGVTPGASAVVMGCGGVGLSAIEGAKVAGATMIVAVDPVPVRLELARQLGATHTVNPLDGDVVAQVMELTGREGADYAFETAGQPNTLRQAVDLLGRAGTAIAIAVPSAEAIAEIQIAPMVFWDKTVRGSMYGSCNFAVDLPRIVDLYARGLLELDKVIGKRLPLESVNEAFDGMESGDVGRTLLLP